MGQLMSCQRDGGLRVGAVFAGIQSAKTAGCLLAERGELCFSRASGLGAGGPGEEGLGRGMQPGSWDSQGEC